MAKFGLKIDISTIQTHIGFLVSNNTANVAMEKATTANVAIEKATIANVAIEKATTANVAIEKAPTANVAIEKATTANVAIEKATTANVAIENAATTNVEKAYYGGVCNENPFHRGFEVLFRFWVSLAERVDITDYFLCFGSLLGWKRNGDTVPYDHDIDVCMFRRDYQKLYPEEEKRPFKWDDGRPHLLIQRNAPDHTKRPNIPRLDCNGTVVTAQTDACAFINPHARLLLGNPPFLDIFLFQDNGESLKDEYTSVILKRDVVLPVRPCVFLGVKTKCPNNVEAYLRRFYGKEFMKPHYLCKNGTWVRNGAKVRRIKVPGM